MAYPGGPAVVPPQRISEDYHRHGQQGNRRPGSADRAFGGSIPTSSQRSPIWRSGRSERMQSGKDQNPPPPSFDENTKAICEELVKLRNQTQADVILMDLQYVLAVLTPRRTRRSPWSRRSANWRGKLASMCSAASHS